ncbi:NUDIX domain-containing protein [Streptomyces sp. NPDC087297]|uniref:NUDIX domain-containing protein n=1 Tax=Streptomyces sp. NPDC087297 TaxID=3365778 RepID=UPI003821887E
MHRRGAFGLAGGTVEPGESFAEAAVRELHERPASQAIPPDAAHLDITSALRHWQRDPADLAPTPSGRLPRPGRRVSRRWPGRGWSRNPAWPAPSPEQSSLSE